MPLSVPLTAAAINTALGYTAANKDVGAAGIGMMCRADGATTNSGATMAGATSSGGGSAMGGTWRNIGNYQISAGNPGEVQRIA